MPVLSLLALVGCTTGDVGFSSLPPVVEILWPADGSSFDPSLPLAFCADVQFAGDVDGLDLELRSDVDGVLATDGFVACDGGSVGIDIVISDAPARLTLTATDSTGATGSAAVTVRPLPNQSPICTVVAPLPGAVFPAGAVVGIAVVVDDPDGGPWTVRVASDRDGEVDGTVVEQAGSISFDLMFSDGRHDIEVQVEDARGARGSCTTWFELSSCGDEDLDGYDVCDGDCDDAAPHTHPYAVELPDGQDNDCDGAVDEGTALGDDDGDGVHELGGDCDDGDPSIHPGAAEIPDDGVDQDCDGADAVSCFVDGDGDGFGAGSVVVSPDGDCDDGGEAAVDGDCDDGDPAVHPGAAEVLADGVDQDCDGVDPVGCYQDLDGDGFGTSVELPPGDGDCDDPGESNFRTDCDDGDPSIHPGAEEIVGDGEDQDCNGEDTVLCHVDADLDGYGGAATVLAADGRCDTGQNEAEDGDDCDDGDPSIHPGRSEVPDDGVDQDCDGVDAVSCFLDGDGDGYGSTVVIVAQDGDCTDPDEADGAGDCDDADPSVHPGGTEIPDDWIDQDCSGADTISCFVDADRDGFGSEVGVLAADGSCDQDQAEAEESGDCDDADPTVHPAGDDSDPTDGVDANCDGVDGYAGPDADGDGVALPDDCDDADPTVYPGAPEIRDAADNDCDGACDEGLIGPGDLVITELMISPDASAPTRGEWFELYNPTNVDIAICDGWRFADDGIDDMPVQGGWVIPAGGYAVAAGNGSPTQNGGIIPDYTYERASLPLSEPDELIVLFQGVEIDRLVWGTEPGDGASWQLDPGALDATLNDDPQRWCDASAPWPGSAGDWGSPGGPNAPCP